MSIIDCVREVIGPRQVLIGLAVIAMPLLLGRSDLADVGLPFVAFLVVLAVIEVVRTDERARRAGDGWRSRLVKALTALALGAVTLAGLYLLWATIGPDREAAPATTAFRALETAIGTMNAQLMLAGGLLVLALLAYRRLKAAERRTPPE